MKKLTDLIKENENTNIYSYKVTMNLKGIIHAMDEGSAGEEVDKDMDHVMQAIDEVGIGIINEGYVVSDIELALDTNSKKNIDNSKVLESLDADREGELYVLAKNLALTITNETTNKEELMYVFNQIKKFTNNSHDTLDSDTSKNTKREFTHGDAMNQDFSKLINLGMLYNKYEEFAIALKEFNNSYDLQLELPLEEDLVSLNNLPDTEENLSKQQIQNSWDEIFINKNK